MSGERGLRDAGEATGGAARPRVAVINTHPIQHFAPLWAEVARGGGVTLKVFYCTDWGVKEYKDPGFGETFRWDVDLLSGYDAEILPIKRRPENMSFREVDNPEVGAALDRFRPDVLVLFGYGTLTNWRALAWARRREVRVLVFSDSELKHARPLWARAAKELVVRAFFSQVDGALPIGNCNAEYYLHYGLPAGSLHACPLPVDGARFLAAAGEAAESREAVRREYGIGAGDFVFASVGKYIARKRHADVAEALLRLPEEARRRSWVMLVGEGPLRTELTMIAGRAGGRVILTGFVNQSRMPAYFAAADVLVVASEHDPHPLVVTEGLFLGLAVIASDRIGCIGPDDTVRPGENGLVYPCGDVGALARAMGRMIEEPEQYRQFCDKSRWIAPSQDTTAAAARFTRAAISAASRPQASLRERARRLVPIPRAASARSIFGVSA
jgi:glycosyltransferase involved in cell wall biosynthesis